MHVLFLFFCVEKWKYFNQFGILLPLPAHFSLSPSLSLPHQPYYFLSPLFQFKSGRFQGGFSAACSDHEAAAAAAGRLLEEPVCASTTKPLLPQLKLLCICSAGCWQWEQTATWALHTYFICKLFCHHPKPLGRTMPQRWQQSGSRPSLRTSSFSQQAHFNMNALGVRDAGMELYLSLRCR